MSEAGDYSRAFSTHCDGIMGFEVIRDEVTEINFQNDKFIFYPKTLDITKRVPDNKRTFLGEAPARWPQQFGNVSGSGKRPGSDHGAGHGELLFIHDSQRRA